MMRTSVSTIETWMRHNAAYTNFDILIRERLDEDFVRVEQALENYTTV